MNKWIIIILILVISAAPLEAGSDRNFTNDDLIKFGASPKTKKTTPPPKTESDVSEKKFDELLIDLYKKMDDQRQTKKYVIPYAGSARRIIIPVTFNRSVTVPMLLDTGATGLHISSRLAEQLGILENEDGILWTRVAGIGGSTPAIFTILDSVQVGEAEDDFIPTTISQATFQGFEGLVGMDFIGKYQMQIDTKKRVLILQEQPESSARPAGHDEAWWRTTFHNFKSLRSQWEQYKDKVSSKGEYTSRLREMKRFVDQQYSRADFLYNRLNVYASEHSVPLQWR